MARSARKKKEKSADFIKPKLKLGKGKKPAVNAIDTSFKARSIALPQQSITAVKDASVPTTKRKLTLEDLLIQLKHYNTGTRRDALLGLRELLEEHNSLIELNLLKIINGCARLISDEDASVRRTLHAFLSWIFPQVQRELLLPHAPTLLLFTVSAQTHIFPETRIDAIRVLDILLETIPDQIADGLLDSNSIGNKSQFGKKFLDGYLGLLSAGARFHEDGSKGVGSSSQVACQLTSLVMLSTASKALILKSFAKFLSHAFPRDAPLSTSDRHASGPQIPLWYLSTSFSSQEAFRSFIKSLFIHHTARARTLENNSALCFQNDENVRNLFPLADPNGGFHVQSTLQDYEQLHEEINCLASLNGGYHKLGRSSSDLIISLCRTVQPILVSSFLDYAPSVFSPTQPYAKAELEILLAVMEITRCLYGHLDRDETIMQDNKQAGYEHLRALLSHMATYFPFGESKMVSQDAKADYAFQHMNLLYCELFSLESFAFSPSSKQEADNGPISKRRKLHHPSSKGAKMSSAGTDRQVKRVREYVIRCLQGTGSTGTSHPLGRTLSTQSYVALLPTLWWLLVQPSRDDDSALDILNAILQHATKVGSTSAVKSVTTEFVSVLVLLQTEKHYKGAFRLSQSLGQVRELLKEWLLHLPKVLSDLGDRNALASECICNFILKFVQRKSWLYNAEVSVALCTRLAPFFTIQHASRGDLPGPYANFQNPAVKLPPEPSNRIDILISSRRLPLDVAAVLISPSYSARSSFENRKLSRRLGQPVVSELNIGTLAIARDGLQAVITPEDEHAARDGLLRSVERAVTGTAEEGYWKQVSSLRF